MNNRKKSFLNVVTGIGSQVLSICLGIIIPRLFLISFGSEMNGLLNSVSQVFAYFALLEAGVGAATIAALYKPISVDDKKSASAILAATDRYYKKTGLLYLVCVVVFAFGYPMVVKSDIDALTIILIILFNGIPGVVSYYFQGKYNLLLQVEGKNYINIVLTTVSTTIISISKIVLLLIGADIVLIQLSYLVINMLKVIVLACYINEKYKWVHLKTDPDYKAIEQKNSAFINQICDLIFRNTDTILLTLFCDLKVVSVYAMYTLLFGMVRTVLDYIAQGFGFILGQTYSKSREYYIKLHDLYETYRMAMIFALYNIAYIFIIPFMKLYTAGVDDVNYLDNMVAVLFVVFYLLTGARACASDLINYAQHFKLTQTRCILEAAINLCVSVVCVQFLGIYGVLVGTIVALIYRANDMVLYANRKILNRGPWVTYRKWISNTIVFVVVSYITSLLRWDLSSYINIIIWACVSGGVIILIYFLVASIVNKDSFVVLSEYIKEELVKQKGNNRSS